MAVTADCHSHTLNIPKIQNAIPVMMELRANATTVVAITERAFSSPAVAVMVSAMICKKGITATHQRKYFVSMHSLSIIMLPFAPAKTLPPQVYVSWDMIVLSRYPELSLDELVQALQLPDKEH
jgi:hypothetical protein